MVFLKSDEARSREQVEALTSVIVLPEVLQRFLSDWFSCCRDEEAPVEKDKIDFYSCVLTEQGKTDPRSFTRDKKLALVEALLPFRLPVFSSHLSVPDLELLTEAVDMYLSKDEQIDKFIRALQTSGVIDMPTVVLQIIALYTVDSDGSSFRKHAFAEFPNKLRSMYVQKFVVSIVHNDFQWTMMYTTVDQTESSAVEQFLLPPSSSSNNQMEDDVNPPTAPDTETKVTEAIPLARFDPVKIAQYWLASPERMNHLLGKYQEKLEREIYDEFVRDKLDPDFFDFVVKQRMRQVFKSYGSACSTADESELKSRIQKELTGSVLEDLSRKPMGKQFFQSRFTPEIRKNMKDRVITQFRYPLDSALFALIHQDTSQISLRLHKQ